MVYDVAVVGAGPIGLEAAAILKADGLNVVTVDSGSIGATISRCFPPHTRFFTSPERLQLFGQAIDPLNQEKLTGEEYLSYLRAYVATHGLNVRTFEQVIAVEDLSDDLAGSGQDDTRSQPLLRLTTQSRSGKRDQLDARRLVLATGGTDKPRTLGIPGEDLPHVRSHLGDPYQYVGRRVLIVGGRNSAAESALRCYRVGAEVHLVHRHPELYERIKYWIKPEVESLMSEGRIVGHLADEVVRITPDHVELASGEELTVDDIVLQIGYEQDKSIFDLAGVQYGGELGAPEFNADTMETTRPGVFVVGTATAGTQDGFGVFIENCHDHGHRVAAAIAGRPSPSPTPTRPIPEV